jgi:hypothetical protein
MTPIRFFTLLLVLFAGHHAAAQVARQGFSLTYVHGTARFPGFSVGYERHYPLSAAYTALTDGQLLVLNRNYQTSLGATFSAGLRRTLNGGLFGEYRLRTGYVADHYGVNYYQFKDPTGVQQVSWTHSWLVGGACGLGYDFSRKTSLRLQAFARVYLFEKLGSTANPFTRAENFGFETGLIYFLQ